MTQITRVPRGLQDFLGSQAFGKNPSELGDVVAPVLEMSPFLGIEKEKWHGEGFAPFNTTPANVSVVVPDGELWLLREVGFLHNGAALSVTDRYTASASLKNIPISSAPANPHPLSQTPYQYEIINPGVAYEEFQSWTLDNIVAWPGGEIEWWIRNIVVAGAGNFTSVAFLRYLELKI